MVSIKRVIDGALYDTDTATEIAYRRVDCDESDASWTLYRTAGGVFFEVVGDQDGIFESLTPLTADQARSWLEKNANSLVPEFFPTRQPKPLQFSTFVIEALVQVISGGPGGLASNEPPIGLYRSMSQIEGFLLACGIQPTDAGSRLPRLRESLTRANNEAGGGEYIRHCIEKVSDPRGYLGQQEKAEAVRDYLNQSLEPDGLAVTIVSGKAYLSERQVAGAIVAPFASKLAVLNFDTVQVEIARVLTNATEDPEDAVTAACSLIESVCRSIIVELGLPLPAKKDLEGLIRPVQEALNLSPGRSDLPSEIEQDIRQILGGLTSVARGVGALRTHGGDAHGREKGFKRIDARIARLAVNAASTAALFFIETWERQQKRALPQHDGRKEE